MNVSILLRKTILETLLEHEDFIFVRVATNLSEPYNRPALPKGLQETFSNNIGMHVGYNLARTVKDLTLEDDHFSGTFHFGKDDIPCFCTIPYSTIIEICLVDPKDFKLARDHIQLVPIAVIYEAEVAPNKPTLKLV